MMIHYEKEYIDLLDVLYPWFCDERNSDGSAILKEDTPEELKALYPRYHKLFLRAKAQRIFD